MQNCPVTSIAITKGSCLAQNCSPGFKSAVEMFPSPHLSVWLSLGRRSCTICSRVGGVPQSTGRNLPAAGPAGSTRSLRVFLVERAPRQCWGHVCMGGCSGTEGHPIPNHLHLLPKQSQLVQNNAPLKTPRQEVRSEQFCSKFTPSCNPD